MAFFKNQPTTLIIGVQGSTLPNTLTSSYVDNSYNGFVEALSAVTLYIEYTPADAASTLLMQVEFGPDQANLFVEGALLDTDTTGLSHIKPHIYDLEAGVPGTPIRRRVILTCADKHYRVSFKEDTVAGFGTVRVLMTRDEE